MKNKSIEILKDIYRHTKSPKIYNPKLRKTPKSILFVCKGNICRSPFAEHMANKIATERSIETMTFFSAGLEANNPLAPPSEVILVAEKFRCDLRDHKSRSIANCMPESYDMIIAMEEWHVKNLREMFPHLRDNTYLLSLFEKQNKKKWYSYSKKNIVDPYGKSLFHFQECFQRIEISLKDLFTHIQNISKNES